MKILNEEHFENVKRYAESIGDTSFQKCLDRLESWEENPDHPNEISLYYDHAPYSFGFTQRYPDGRTGIVGGLLYHGIRTGLLPSHWNRSTDGRYIPDRNKRKSNINIVLT